ncbi:MAG: arylsulfotransferase family protein [Bacteroidia bacterium]|nr:arylsulfotransferase family protein [Bacteroidia bacterium]
MRAVSLKFLICILVASVSIHAQIPQYTITSQNPELNRGFFFLAPFKMRMTVAKPLNFLLISDMKGNPVYYKDSVYASDFKMHSNGVFSYFNSRCFVLMDGNFMIYDSVQCVNGAETDSHDFQILPNGNYVLIGMRTETGNLSKFHPKGAESWKGSAKIKLKYGIIQELSPDKKLVYEWNSKGEFPLEDFDPVYFKDTSKLDIPHFNSVDIDSAGNYLVSARYSNEVVYVNKATSKIEWRLGGKRSTFSFSDNVPFLGQHDARFLPNKNILLFDNGYSYTGNTHNARGVEYQLDFKKKQALVVWKYEWHKPLVSDATGGTQRIENGYTVIDFGKVQNMQQNILAAVADSSGKTMMEITFADTMGSYRAFWYPALNTTFERPDIYYLRFEGSLHLMTHASGNIEWNTGTKGNELIVSKPGKYYVTQTRKDGSLAISETIEVGDGLQVISGAGK